MTEHLLGKRLAECHKHYRPVDGVESQDVLTDEVKVARPVLFVKLAVIAVGIVSESGDVVAQSIDPNINGVVRIEINRDAPLDGCSRNAQVLKARKKEVLHHLVLTRLGLDELGMSVYVVDQTIGVLAHLEEISLFLRGRALPATVGTLTVLELRSGKK